MTVLEFGDKDKRKIVLIHGFQSPYQVWDAYIEHYKSLFHVIVPIMPGHNPESKADFISFAETARAFEDYYIPRYGKDVYAVYGMSMGGVLAATLWQNKKLNIENVILDGTPLTSFSSILEKMMLRFYRSITHKARQRERKTLEQAVKSIISKENLDAFLRVLDQMSDATIKNCISDVARFKLSAGINGATDTKIYYYHGTAANEMLAKKSAKYLSKNYPNSIIKCFKGKAHCENSLLHPERMIAELDRTLL